MVVEWFIKGMVAVISFGLGLLPTSNPPSWLTGRDSNIASILQGAAGLGAWVPLSLGATIATAVLACAVIGFAIKITRIVLSLFSAGGGSAG